MNKDSLFGVIKIHCSFDLVVCSNLKGNNLQCDEARSHGEDLGPVSGFVQVLPCVRVRHARRVTAHDVEVGTGHHPSSAMPLNLWRKIEIVKTEETLRRPL